MVADNTVKSITLSNKNTVMAEKNLPASPQAEAPAGSGGVCCKDYSKTSNSCVCGCSTSPYCTTSSEQIIFWVLGAIVVAAIAIVLTSVLLRRTHRKAQTRGKGKKE